MYFASFDPCYFDTLVNFDIELVVFTIFVNHIRIEEAIVEVVILACTKELMVSIVKSICIATKEVPIVLILVTLLVYHFRRFY